MMGDSVIYYVEQADKPVNRASERARKTFKYFWRELFWERRRIIPALDFAMVKAPFSKTAKTAKFANICGSTIFILTVFTFMAC